MVIFLGEGDGEGGGVFMPCNECFKILEQHTIFHNLSKNDSVNTLTYVQYAPKAPQQKFTDCRPGKDPCQECNGYTHTQLVMVNNKLIQSVLKVFIPRLLNKEVTVYFNMLE
jgi:hypothetical protein